MHRSRCGLHHAASADGWCATGADGGIDAGAAPGVCAGSGRGGCDPSVAPGCAGVTLPFPVASSAGDAAFAPGSVPSVALVSPPAPVRAAAPRESPAASPVPTGASGGAGSLVGRSSALTNTHNRIVLSRSVAHDAIMSCLGWALTPRTTSAHAQRGWRRRATARDQCVRGCARIQRGAKATSCAPVCPCSTCSICLVCRFHR